MKFKKNTVSLHLICSYVHESLGTGIMKIMWMSAIHSGS